MEVYLPVYRAYRDDGVYCPSLVTVKRKGKEAYLYNAVLCTMYISRRSDMDHTVLPANAPCLPFLRKHSPDGTNP